MFDKTQICFRPKNLDTHKPNFLDFLIFSRLHFQEECWSKYIEKSTNLNLQINLISNYITKIGCSLIHQRFFLRKEEFYTPMTSILRDAFLSFRILNLKICIEYSGFFSKILYENHSFIHWHCMTWSSSGSWKFPLCLILNWLRLM